MKYVGKITITSLVLTAIICCTTIKVNAQEEEQENSRKAKFKSLANKAAGAVTNKPYYWNMTMISPVELKTEKVNFPYKDENVSLEFWFNHGAGKMGVQGPDHICIDFINPTEDVITVKWDEMKISNLKGDGVRNKVKQMHGSAVYAPEAQTVDAGEKVQFCASAQHCIRTYHHNGHYNDQGQWVEAWDQLEDFRVFCDGDCDPEISDAGMNVEKMKAAVVGKEFTIFLPIEVNGNEIKKSFTFRIEDVKMYN